MKCYSHERRGSYIIWSGAPIVSTYLWTQSLTVVCLLALTRSGRTHHSHHSLLNKTSWTSSYEINESFVSWSKTNDIVPHQKWDVELELFLLWNLTNPFRPPKWKERRRGVSAEGNFNRRTQGSDLSLMKTEAKVDLRRIWPQVEGGRVERRACDEMDRRSQWATEKQVNK